MILFNILCRTLHLSDSRPSLIYGQSFGLHQPLPKFPLIVWTNTTLLYFGKHPTNQSFWDLIIQKVLEIYIMSNLRFKHWNHTYIQNCPWSIVWKSLLCIALWCAAGMGDLLSEMEQSETICSQSFLRWFWARESKKTSGITISSQSSVPQDLCGAVQRQVQKKNIFQSGLALLPKIYCQNKFLFLQMPNCVCQELSTLHVLHLQAHFKCWYLEKKTRPNCAGKVRIN